jgi:nitrous oxidase accessory protein
MKNLKMIFLPMLFLPLYLGANNFEELYKNTKSGGTLTLTKGVYQVNDFVIDKPIQIVGESGAVLDAAGKGEILLIKTADVSIINIEFRNTKRGYMEDFAAIKAFKTHHIRIVNCNFTNTFFGIYFSEVDTSTIEGCNIIGSSNLGNCGDGIHLWYSDGILLKNNRIIKHRDGMYFEFAKNSLIVNNYTEQNQRYGLHFMFSDNDTFIRNTFKLNGTGVAVMYSKNINMLQNDFEENWGGATYGMLCKDISDSKIHCNRYYKNTTAIYMEGSSRMLVDSNDFKSNGWAIKLMASCEGIDFEKNNFIQNSFDLSTNGTLFLNKLNNNYWEKYTGYDLNKDNIGDVPFRPVSMYSMMIEQMPFVIMLMRSLIIELLDTAERSIPSLTPENIKDSNPLMKELLFDDRTKRAA